LEKILDISHRCVSVLARYLFVLESNIIKIQKIQGLKFDELRRVDELIKTLSILESNVLKLKTSERPSFRLFLEVWDLMIVTNLKSSSIYWSEIHSNFGLEKMENYSGTVEEGWG
jgi:hypothetical protein